MAALAPDQVFVPPGIRPVYPLSVVDVAGPQIVGPWLSSALCVRAGQTVLMSSFGIFVVQCFAWYEERHAGRKDHWLDVALVFCIAAASTVTWALQAVDLWRSFVIGYVACARPR